MKQTSSALTFLLAQYRAIFKHAYIKGLAPAVLLTAGLAAGAAPTATAADLSATLLPNSGQTANIDGSGTDSAYDNDVIDVANIKVSGSGTWHGTINITSGAAASSANFIKSDGSSETTSITGNGTLNINVSDTTASGNGLLITGETKAVEVAIDQANLTRGELKVSDSGGSASGSATFEANTITIGSTDSKGGALNAYLTLESKGTGTSGTIGRATENGVSGTTINVYGDGIFTLQGATNAQVLGAALNIKNGGLMLTDSGSANKVVTDDFTLDSKSFKIISGTGANVKETFEGHTGTVQGNVLVGTSGTWVISDTEDEDANQKDIQTTVTFDSGSNVQLTGTLEISGGHVIVNDNAGLHSLTAASGNNSGAIVIANKGDSEGTLTISTSNLKTFLAGSGKHYAISKEASGGKLAETASDDVSGAILLSGGTLDLTGTTATKPFDLATELAISGSTANAGKIGITSASGTIAADYLAVSKQLSDQNSSTLIGSTSNLKLKAYESLTLGSSTLDTSTTTDLGFASATTKDLILQYSGSEFVLQKNAINLRAVQLNGNDIEVSDTGVISGNLNVSGTTLTVEAGAYSMADDLTISSGTVAINGLSGSSTNDENGEAYYGGAIDSSLTLTGDFKIQHANDDTKAKLTITGDSGANAVLDLTDADTVTWGLGQIEVSGVDPVRYSATDTEATAGNGTLKIKGSHFQNFLSGQTKLSLKDYGVLSVDGTTTSTSITVDDFTTSSAVSGTVYFSGTGSVVEFNTNQTINITNDTTGAALAIGKGTIKAPTLNLNNTKDGAENFTVSGGTLQVASGLTSNVGSVVFKDESSNGGKLLLDGAGSVSVDTTFSGTNSALNVASGKWTAQNAAFDGADFTVGSADSYASLELSNLNLSGTGVSGTVSGELTVATMQSDKATTPAITINDGANMTITGRAYTGSEDLKDDPTKGYEKTAGINLKGTTFNVNGAEAQLKLGNTAVSALITGAGTGTADNSNLKVDDALKATYTLSEFSTLYLDFAESTKLNAADAKALKEQLFKDGNVGDGIINVGAASLAIKWTDESNRVTTWDNVKEFAEIESVTSDTLKQALITDVKGTVAGHYGAMQVAASTDLTVAGNLGLHAARDGYFVFSQSGESKTTEGVVISKGSLLLAGAGKIGDISAGGHNVTIAASTLENAVAGVTEVQGALTNAGILKVSNETTVAGNVSADSLELGANTSLSNVLDGAVTTMELGSADLAAGSTLNATNLSLTGENNEGSWLMGTVDVLDTLTVGSDGATDIVIANGTITANETVLASGVTLRVGLDANALEDDPLTTDVDESKPFTGSFETQSLELKGGILIVDPTFEQQTAIASVYHFGDVTAKDMVDDKLVGTMDGSVFVGQNSALGVGTEDLTALREVVSHYQVNGSLAGDYGSILYLAGTTTIAAGQGVVMTAQSLTDFIDHVQTDGTIGAGLTTSDPTLDNKIFFGEGAALIATADAVNAAQQRGSALITFENEGQLVADGGELLISGDLRANGTGYNLFADQSTDHKVAVIDIDGATVKDGNGIAVKTENGFLVGEINNTNGGQGVTLSLAHNARGIMSGASDPVYQTLVAYAQGYNSKWTEDGQEHYDYLYDGYELDDKGEVMMGPDDQPIENRDYSNYFLAAAVGQGNGAAAEAAARLGVYGGAPQAALSAGKSSTDAIASRFGIGSAFSNLTLAGNTQGATLWLAPVYKSADSDGFEAQSVDYGVDVDLYGVALGADYTMSNGITFGAMFNVGSGDIDGEGAAAAVSNDFDYYGFGIYGGYAVGQFSVIGDVSYTVADNEIEANTAVDRIGAKMDSSNLSLGVTGKYALEFNGVNITPHAGLRFSNIDLDDYTIDGEDVVAHADSDSLNLFAIPVGVTIAKEFKGESWTVAPSFDLTLTGQFGDDELDGDVSWAGVSNLTTHTTTEVIDNFTYGATLGVEAQSVGGIALGLSVGYTGSSNTDEFGVNANARFTF